MTPDYTHTRCFCPELCVDLPSSLCAHCAIVFIVRNMFCSHNREWRSVVFEQRDNGDEIPEDSARWLSDVEESDGDAENSAARSCQT